MQSELIKQKDIFSIVKADGRYWVREYFRVEAACDDLGRAEAKMNELLEERKARIARLAAKNQGK